MVAIEEITIDESHIDVVTINNLKAGETGPVITIKSPKGQKIEIIGTDGVDNKRDTHALRTRIADKNDNAIDFYTKIVITHEKSNEIIRTIKLYYYDISMVKDASLYEDINLTKRVTFYRHKTDLEWYRFKNMIILDEEDMLVISVINPKRDIEKVKLALGAIIKNK